MTKQEIKDLIAAKIAGQGSAVDVGGALPVILNEILDNARGLRIILAKAAIGDGFGGTTTIDELLTYLGIDKTKPELDSMLRDGCMIWFADWKLVVTAFSGNFDDGTIRLRAGDQGGGTGAFFELYDNGDGTITYEGGAL